jgi:hypothetical protein
MLHGQQDSRDKSAKEQYAQEIGYSPEVRCSRWGSYLYQKGHFASPSEVPSNRMLLVYCSPPCQYAPGSLHGWACLSAAKTLHQCALCDAWLVLLTFCRSGRRSTAGSLVWARLSLVRESDFSQSSPVVSCYEAVERGSMAH